MTVLIPHFVLAAGWIPFFFVTLLVLLFSFIYIRFYQDKYDKELCSTLTAIVGLALAMFTCALLPVDIFLVSYMKNNDGTFKDWAQDAQTREAVENGVLYAYYALYCCVILFLFFILPLSYFYYEEGDEDEQTNWKSRCCTALKYCLVFIFMAMVLFLIGVFVPFKTSPPNNATLSDWEQIKNLFEDLGNNHGENAFSFMISFLSFFGMFTIVIYTGIGMGVWPIHLVKGRRSVLREYREVSTQRSVTRSQIDTLRSATATRALSARERRQLQSLEDEEALISRRERHLEAAENSCLRKCFLVMRPFQISLGIFFILISLLIFMSLLLSNIDKLMNSLGPKMGYILPVRTLPNALDIVLVFSQKVFPLDYILLVSVVFFLIFCSMGGINAIGVWFLWIKMFRIRAHKTRPQGLLFLCFLLMYIVLALNVFLYELTPQYFTYGSQHYQVNTTLNGNITSSLHPCSTAAPADECIMTRMATLLYRFFYKLWFFGAAYYWMSWAFLLVFVISFIVAVVRKRRSYIEGEVDEEDDSDSDERMIRNI